VSLPPPPSPPGFVQVLAKALSQQWQESKACGFEASPPEDALMESTELRVQFSARVQRTGTLRWWKFDRQLGSNEVGMVGWEVRMATPEFPGGRPATGRRK